MENKTFFRNAKANHMRLGDIFSDVGKKHTKEETAEVFIGGTELTTPKEEEMLAGWKKPFVFARFFGWGFLFCILLYIVWWFYGAGAGIYTLLFILPCLIPLSCLIMVWEMNIPRNISLAEVFKMMAIGGAISVIMTFLLSYLFGGTTSVWAGLIEEPAKLIAVFLFLKKKNRKYILNGVLVGFSVGAGFAVIESIQYTWNAYSEYMIYAAQEGYEASDILAFAGIVGLCLALARAITAIPGHGGYAALYAGALVKVKGEDEVQISHLFQPEFLKYFVLSIALHALHNYMAGKGSVFGLPVIKLFPKYTNMELAPEILLVSVIAVWMLLMILKMGVNEVVDICMAENNGRLTQAVMRQGGVKAASLGSPEKSRSGARLEGIEGEVKGRVYTVSAGQTIVIGRSAGADGISLPGNFSVSGRHCQITWKEDGLYVMDMSSTNGTWVGDRKLSPNQNYRLSDGSVIYLGNKNCGFRVKM